MSNDTRSNKRCHQRREANGPGWQEHFVDVKRASNSASVGLAVSQSLSYVTISHFASIEERQALIQSASDCNNCNNDSQEEIHSSSNSNHILFASATNTNCNRFSVETLLNDGAKRASNVLLNRLLGFLDGSLGGEGEDSLSGENNNNKSNGNPAKFFPQGGGHRMSLLAEEVFGSSSDLRSMKVTWYDEPDESGILHPEPKVNLYSEGGYFSQHSDGMELTLLVVLTDEFEGGGTAFYKDSDPPPQDDDGDDDIKNESKEISKPVSPERIAKPPAGTAMIWGGTLQHMALPVTKGSRAVYVGSFDLN